MERTLIRELSVDPITEDKVKMIGVYVRLHHPETCWQGWLSALRQDAGPLVSPLCGVARQVLLSTYTRSADYVASFANILPLAIQAMGDKPDEFKGKFQNFLNLLGKDSIYDLDFLKELQQYFKKPSSSSSTSHQITQDQPKAAPHESLPSIAPKAESLNKEPGQTLGKGESSKSSNTTSLTLSDSLANRTNTASSSSSKEKSRESTYRPNDFYIPEDTDSEEDDNEVSSRKRGLEGDDSINDVHKKSKNTYEFDIDNPYGPNAVWDPVNKIFRPSEIDTNDIDESWRD